MQQQPKPGKITEVPARPNPGRDVPGTPGPVVNPPAQPKVPKPEPLKVPEIPQTNPPIPEKPEVAR